jgi:hypothetical protein
MLIGVTIYLAGSVNEKHSQQLGKTTMGVFLLEERKSLRNAFPGAVFSLYKVCIPFSSKTFRYFPIIQTCRRTEAFFTEKYFYSLTKKTYCV